MEHMKTCPLCGDSVTWDPVRVNEFASYKKGLDKDTLAMYSHVNDDKACHGTKPVCPECKMNFQDGAHGPWRRFAVHWRKYGHLTGEEHVIIAALGGEDVV
jgi:ribosomal protein S27AE